MKKAICICLLVISIFCSCTKQPQNSSPVKTGEAFVCTAEIVLNENEFVCELNYKNSANAELKIISPEQLKGVSFTLTNSSLSAEYNGSSFPISPKSNAVSTAKLIFSALGRATNTNDFKTDNGGAKYTEGEFSSHKYRLNFNKDSGLPESFEVKDLNFSCRFKNFKFLE